MKSLAQLITSGIIFYSVCISAVQATSFSSGRPFKNSSNSKISNHLISQNISQESICREEISKVGRLMSSNYKVILTEVYTQDIFYGNSPFSDNGRELRYIIDIHKSVPSFVNHRYWEGVNFLSSQKTQLSFAKSIMKKCSLIHVVTFGGANSGILVPHFRMPSGLIMTGTSVECMGRTSNRTVDWGFYQDC